MVEIIFGMVFMIIGIMICLLLKKEFKSFYNKYKRIMIGATVLLTVPLTASGIFQLVRGVNENAYKFMKSDSYSVGINTLVHIIGNTIPLLSQLCSLIFGYIRRKQDKNLTRRVS